MSQWAEIRHQHLVEQVPKKELARRFGVNVKTVRRALMREEPPFRRPSEPRQRRLDRHRSKIEAWLLEDPKITAKRIGRLLEPKAGPLNERTVRKYVADVRQKLFPKEGFIHRTHPPGATMEADFGESWAVVAGQKRKVKFLVVTLPASNVYFARAYPVERLECLLDGLAEAFTFFGGVPERVVFDNTSLAVKKVLKGRDRLETEAFHGFRGAYPFGAEFCAPAKGNEKGSVENGVKYVRNNAFRPMPDVEGFEALNQKIREEIEADLDRRTLPDGRTARQAWHAEREHLRPLPLHRPETCRRLQRVADKFGHVRVAGGVYSVPIRHAYQPVWVKAFWDRIEIAVGDEVVAHHDRTYEPGAYQLDAHHVLSLLEKKHRAAAESTAVQSWHLPEAFEQLRKALQGATRKPDQEWVQVLRLTEEHDLEEVAQATAEALDRDSGRLETIRQILRSRERGQAVRPCRAPPCVLDDAEIEVPDLAEYDHV